MPREVARLSAKANSGRWQDAQAIVPRPESIGSKKRARPRANSSSLAVNPSARGSTPFGAMRTKGVGRVSSGTRGRVSGPTAFLGSSSWAAPKSGRDATGRGPAPRILVRGRSWESGPRYLPAFFRSFAMTSSIALPLCPRYAIVPSTSSTR